MNEEQTSKFDSLVKQLAALNCQDPRSWAKPEVDEGMPQLSRFNFLRELWQTLTPRHEPLFLKGCGLCVEGTSVGPPIGADGPFERLQKSNADMDDVIEIARHAQISALLSVTMLLDNASMSGPSVEDSSWGLFEFDEEDNPGRRVDGLHESFLDPDVINSVAHDSGDSNKVG